MERTGDHFPFLKDGHQYEEELQRLRNQYEEEEKLPVLLFFGHTQKQQAL